MSWSPSPRIQKKAAEIAAAYPDPHAACIPLLHEIQAEIGFLPKESLSWLARTLSMSRSIVEGVASFYTMFHTEPVGKYHLELCTNVSCSLCGSESLLRALEKELGIRAGETTGDGLFTLSEVECLATCGMGPAMQVGDEIHENLTPQKVVELIGELRRRG
jgi:NADH-quinone oxidoreductase subunit E